VLVVAAINFLNAASPDQLFFNKPAQFFEEAFVMGNGRIGATVFGSPQAEKIYLNDATLWTRSIRQMAELQRIKRNQDQCMMC
jgi:alpha-L-fucosidase 2